MKKVYSLLAVVFLILVFSSINSCKKEIVTLPDVNNCVELGNAYNLALIAYINDQTDYDKCVVFVDAAQDYIDGCDVLTAEQKAEMQEQIDNANCGGGE
jgi:hypothetical protein